MLFRRVTRIILFLVLLLQLGCSGNSTDFTGSNGEILDYKYGVIYTSNLKADSQIILYSNKGRKLKSIDLNVGGLRKNVRYKNKVYIPILGVPNALDNRVLEVDINSLETRYLETKEAPMALDVHRDFLYVIHNTHRDYGLLTKINIANNTIVNEVKLNGVLREIVAEDDGVFVAADQPRKKEHLIYQVSTDLTQTQVFKNRYTAFAVDSIVEDGKLLLVSSSTNDFSKPAHEYVEFDINSHSISKVPLQESSPYQIFDLEKQRIVTQYQRNMPNDDFKVTVIDKQTGKQNVFKLKNKLFHTALNGNTLISTDKVGLFVYELENFKLMEQFNLEENKEMVISDFFVKND